MNTGGGEVMNNACVYQFFKILILIVFITQFVPLAYASGVKLSWEESSGGIVAGYKVYYGTASRTYQSCLDAGTSTSIEIDGLTRGITYYFAVRAYDYSGTESTYSEEIQAIIPANSGSSSSASSISGSSSSSSSGSGTGSSGGGGCFISTSVSGSPFSQGTILLMLSCMVLMVISSLLRKYHQLGFHGESSPPRPYLRRKNW